VCRPIGERKKERQKERKKERRKTVITFISGTHGITKYAGKKLQETISNEIGERYG